jgi:hypothetical protein
VLFNDTCFVGLGLAILDAAATADDDHHRCGLLGQLHLARLERSQQVPVGFSLLDTFDSESVV